MTEHYHSNNGMKNDDFSYTKHSYSINSVFTKAVTPRN